MIKVQLLGNSLSENRGKYNFLMSYFKFFSLKLEIYLIDVMTIKYDFEFYLPLALAESSSSDNEELPHLNTTTSPEK